VLLLFKILTFTWKVIILSDVYAVTFAFSALTLLVGRQEGPVKIEWWGAGVVVWSEVQTGIWPS